MNLLNLFFKVLSLLKILFSSGFRIAFFKILPFTGKPSGLLSTYYMYYNTNFLCFAGTNIENVLRVWIHTAGQCQILFAMWERGIGDTNHPNCPLSQHSSKRQKNSSMWCRDPKLKQVLQWVWLVYKSQSFSARGCHV